MTDFLKHMQVRIEDEKLYKKFMSKLEDEGMTQQGFFMSKIKKFVNPKKKRRKK